MIKVYHRCSDRKFRMTAYQFNKDNKLVLLWKEVFTSVHCVVIGMTTYKS